MTNFKTGPNVVLLSSDTKLAKSIASGLLDTNDGGKLGLNIDFISERENVSDIRSFEAIIYDVDIVDGDLQYVTVDILEFKNSKPLIPIVLIGSRQDVAAAMASEQIAPLIARAITKPILTAQLLLVIDLVCSKRNENPMLSGTAGKHARLLTPAIIGFALLVSLVFYFFSKHDDQALIAGFATATELTQVSSNTVPPENFRRSPDSEVTRLYEAAMLAQTEGKLILPETDNALFFLNRVLAIDPYHDGAYTHRQRLLNKARESFPQALAMDDFEQAQKIIDILTQGDPFNAQNADFRLALNRSLKQQTNRGAKLIEHENVVRVLEIEQRKRTEIYAAIKVNNLIPPSENNAYSLLLSALGRKSLDGVSFDAAKRSLANALSQVAMQNIAKSELSQASKVVSYIRNLDKGHSSLSELRELLLSKMSDIGASSLAQNSSDQASEGRKQALKIEPSKVLTKAGADYPKRAHNLGIEGWVEVQYQVNQQGRAVNIEVIQAQPEKVFEKSAIKAIKSWTFEPAVDLLTGQPVMSDPSASKFNFVLRS